MPFGIKFPEEEMEPEEIRGVLPVRVDCFDELITKKGIERGSTLLITGGFGTGKSTFALQSVYKGLLQGEQAVYISFEEQIEKIKKHVKENFGWDLAAMEKKNRLMMLRIDPFNIARSVEASLAQKKGDLLVSVEEIEFPFIPDRIVVDSLSALNIAFMGNVENYRYYVRYLFEMLEKYDSVNFIISETRSDPGVYKKSGTAEFLADGVVVLYNISTKVGLERKRALEILKLRGQNHIKSAVPFEFTKNGIKILKNQKLGLEK